MIVITTHTNADFDSLASMVAVRHFYPDAVLVFAGAAESQLRRFIEAHKPELPPIVALKDLDLDSVERLVCVDVSTKDRLGPLASLLEGDTPIPVDLYNHHPGQGDLLGEVHVVREAGACASVLVEELVASGLAPSPSEATLFLLGIYEDTGFLTFPTTRPGDLQAALQCLNWGGDLGAVSRTLRRGLTEDQMRLLPELLENLESVQIGGTRVHITVLRTEAYVPDLSLLVHEILAIEGLEALFLLAASEGRVHIIARSRTPTVDAGRVLKAMGGGGHASAASAVVRGQTPEQVRASLLEELTVLHPVGLKASDIMTREFRRIQGSASAQEAFREMNHYHVNALPIFEGERLLGAVTRQEIDGALHHGLESSPIRDFIISTPPLLSPETPVEEVRRQIMDRNWRIVLFGESRDRVEGLISRMTLFKALFQQPQERLFHRAGGHPSAREITSLAAAAFPPEEMARLRTLGQLAAQQGVGCLLVGGAVRDLLLGRPVQDVDFVVEGDAAELAEAWASREGGRVRSHRAFGTAVWVRPGGGHWDFATARAEYYEAPAALPTVVAHAALYQDLYRRDFTINTIAMAIAPEKFGDLLDPFGGVRDLRAGKIRVLHGLSFVEDPTRAFRAVRFAVRLGFTLLPETERLIASAHRQGVFRHLSPKRVLAEVAQVLSGPNAVEGIKAMESHKLLGVFWPPFKLTPKVLETLYRVQRAVDLFEAHFPDAPLDKPCVYLMALVERLSASDSQAFLARYPFSRKTRELLERAKSLTWRALRKMGGAAPSAGEAYRALSGEPLEGVLFVMAQVNTLEGQARVRDFLVKDRFVRLEITGRDLVKAGVPASAAVAKALLATRAAKVEGRVSGKSQELAFALSEAGKGEA